MTKRKTRNFRTSPTEIKKHTERLLFSYQHSATLHEVRGQAQGTRVKNLVTSPSKKPIPHLNVTEPLDDSHSESINTPEKHTQVSIIFMCSDYF